MSIVFTTIENFQSQKMIHKALSKNLDKREVSYILFK